MLGRSVVVRTDHAALTHLMGTHEPIGQQGRWLDLLAEYDITVQHWPGRVHGNSDALSRRPCECDGGPQCRQCRRPVSRNVESAGVSAMQEVPLGTSAGVTAEQTVVTTVSVTNTVNSAVNTTNSVVRDAVSITNTVPMQFCTVGY